MDDQEGSGNPCFSDAVPLSDQRQKKQKCLKKASDTLKHETEITKGDWDTDRVSVAQEWQFGKFELFIDRLRRIDTPVFHSAMENLGVLIKLSTLIGKKFY